MVDGLNKVVQRRAARPCSQPCNHFMSCIMVLVTRKARGAMDLEQRKRVMSLMKRKIQCIVPDNSCDAHKLVKNACWLRM